MYNLGLPYEGGSRLVFIWLSLQGGIGEMLAIGYKNLS